MSHAVCLCVSGVRPQKCTQQVKITVRDYEEAKQARMAAEDKARDLLTQNEAMDTQMHKLQRVSHYHHRTQRVFEYASCGLEACRMTSQGIRD